MAITAGADKDGKGVTGGDLTLHRIAKIICRARQMAIDAIDIGVTAEVGGMCDIMGLILVATGAQSVGVIC